MQLASLTKGYSGDDMKNVVRDAVMEPLRDALSAEWFVFEADQTGKQWWFPCAKEVLGARQATMDDLPE